MPVRVSRSGGGFPGPFIGETNVVRVPRRRQSPWRSARRALARPGALVALLVLPVALPLAGCSGSRARELPRAKPGERVAFADYSILPPAGEGWRVAEHRDNAIVFGRLLSRTHSMVALTSEKTIDRDIQSQQALLAFEKAEWETSDWKHDPRYEARQSDLQADSRFGPYCVRYRQQSEDHGASNRGNAPFLLQHSMGLVCFQPKRPKHLVHAGYTERGLPEEMSPHFADDANHFLSGLRLADLP